MEEEILNAWYKEYLRESTLLFYRKRV
jgi:hypothetical protein